MKQINILLLIVVLFLCSCGKEFLNIKRDGSQIIPYTLADYQSILDNVNVFNFDSGNRLAIIGGDEYFLSDQSYASLTAPYEKNGYLWGKDVYEGQSVHDWNIGYHRILLANLVLEGVDGIEPNVDEGVLNNVKGNALFVRAYNFYQLAQLFCHPYDERSASTDLGIPIRLESDITITTPRSNVEATYEQIIVDFREAADLLPVYSGNLYRPSKVAAYTMLAKAYLHLGDYINGAEAADRALALKNELIDYNDIDVDSDLPFPMLPVSREENKEIIYFSMMSNIPVIQVSRFNADTILLGLYEAEDLRRRAYFYEENDGRVVFKGSYVGGGPYAFFSGLAVDELYLIAAECHARQGNLQEALEHVNFLRKHRFLTATFEPLANLTKEGILTYIIEERRKELVLRGNCWEDVRRLRRDTMFSRSLKRIIEGETYLLEPGSPKLAWPIPEDEIAINNMLQNER
ncbi:RagB/SusD family nutrient uptake outer membrane protein [Parapedobacter tibetensis]|uniref:RagB/SusD family nutrient uptake outer membrane protein n=1 Tax=Parapedobacter tibetensis TaxID=2972951 RepID=UPI00214D1D4D|nr:RagB/SusD family nutrient uptake outer membrane protein [Parapedobacter tibetensis]